MIREAFRAILLSDAALSTAVAGSRVYPLIMPQGVRDASLVYQRISGIVDILMDGPQALRETRLQLDAWAADPDDAAALIALAETKLNGFSGIVPYGDDSPQATLQVQGVFPVNERDGYDSNAQLYREGRDYRVLWCPQ